MKLIGKFLAKKIASLLILVLLVAGLAFYFRANWLSFFEGSLSSRYDFVITRFERESQLVIAGADVKTTSTQVFTNNTVKDWPDWIQPLTRVIIGRDLVVDIPTKTEFKLELKDVTKEDVVITEGVLSFKHPLTVYVDSQPVDVPVIKKSGSGLIDKVVDHYTSGKKAMDFLAEKSQAAMYVTSEHVLSEPERQDKVAEFASQSLENLLNLDNKDKLKVQLTADDLTFVIADKKE